MAKNFDPATIRTLFTQALMQIKQEASAQMSSLNRNASNRSVNSLTPVVIDECHAELWGLPIWGGTNGNSIMERGRKGGAIPKGFTRIIRQWIIDKGLPVRAIPAKTARGNRSGIDPNERGLRNMAGAIAVSIKRHGTRLNRRNGFDDIITTNAQIATQQLSDRLIWYLDETVVSILGKQTKF